MIEIRAVGILKQHIPPGTTVANASTVGEAVEQLALPQSGELILLVNGKPAYWNTELRDGDTLSLVPAISGGYGANDDPPNRRFSRLHIFPA